MISFPFPDGPLLIAHVQALAALKEYLFGPLKLNLADLQAVAALGGCEIAGSTG